MSNWPLYRIDWLFKPTMSTTNDLDELSSSGTDIDIDSTDGNTSSGGESFTDFSLDPSVFDPIDNDSNNSTADEINPQAAAVIGKNVI